MYPNSAINEAKLHIFQPNFASPYKVVMYDVRVPAGFPSPAADYVQKELDLNEYLVRHKAATFMAVVEGSSMIHANIFDGDIILIDRAEEAVNKSIVAAIVDGCFLIKRFFKTDKGVFLKSENPSYPTIFIQDGMDFEIWGVVTHIIHKAR
jgi:DNA polymerase V